MSRELERYWRLLDTLRGRRRRQGWTPPDERDLLEEIDDVFETLSAAEQATARAGTWRGWPDQYDARFKESRNLVESVDPDARESGARPAREAA